MNTSQDTNELTKAMVEAAPEISSISKSKQAYGYKYATLDSLIDMLRGVLPKHGLWFWQIPTRVEGKSYLTTRIIHSSGQWIEDTIEMTDTELQGKANDTQKIGASITYYRRYVLSALFGIAADEDVDGNLNNVKPQLKQRPQETERKQDPKVYILADFSRRMESGEQKESILKDYANLLKTDNMKKLSQMTDADKRELATAIFLRNKELKNA